MELQPEDLMDDDAVDEGVALSSALSSDVSPELP